MFYRVLNPLSCVFILDGDAVKSISNVLIAWLDSTLVLGLNPNIGSSPRPVRPQHYIRLPDVALSFFVVVAASAIPHRR